MNDLIKQALIKYESVKSVKERIILYFERNSAARTYADLCLANGWPLTFDHLTIRTYNIDLAAQEFEALGWTYDETLEYAQEGWWAKIYRQDGLAPFFIDQNYEDAPTQQKIISQWVEHFGDRDLHHIAFTLPNSITMEDVIPALKERRISFPGSVTGAKGSRLRQIFSGAEIYDGKPYSVLELTERGVDAHTGEFYSGFIGEQANSLMKDSIKEAN